MDEKTTETAVFTPEVAPVDPNTTLDTATGFADRWGVDYAAATGFIKVLIALGNAKEEGKKPASGGRGKPSILYRVPNSVTLDLKKDVREASAAVA